MIWYDYMDFYRELTELYSHSAQEAFAKWQILWKQNVFMLLFDNCLHLAMNESTPLRVILFNFSVGKLLCHLMAWSDTVGTSSKLCAKLLSLLLSSLLLLDKTISLKTYSMEKVVNSRSYTAIESSVLMATILGALIVYTVIGCLKWVMVRVYVFGT